MAEPQPSNVTEGADAPDVLPANAEDRKAAQALSSLDAKGDDNAGPKKEVDTKALGEAMRNLELAQKPAAGTSVAKKEEAPKKLVKVDAADVNLLVGVDSFYTENSLLTGLRCRLSSWTSPKPGRRICSGRTRRTS